MECVPQDHLMAAQPFSPYHSTLQAAPLAVSASAGKHHSLLSFYKAGVIDKAFLDSFFYSDLEKVSSSWQGCFLTVE